MSQPKEFPQNLRPLFAHDDTPLRCICYDDPDLHAIIYAPLQENPPDFIGWVLETIAQDEDCYDSLEPWVKKYQLQIQVEQQEREEQFSALFGQLLDAQGLTNTKAGKVFKGKHATVKKWRKGKLSPAPSRGQLVKLQKVGLPTEAVNQLLTAWSEPPLTDDELWHSDVDLTNIPKLTEPVFNPPDPQSREFVGREGQLASLRATFTAKKRAVQAQVISGLGGVGKTELAIQYAHRYKDEYQVVWWIQAEEATPLATDFNRLTTPLGLPGEKIDDIERVRGIVKQWLADNKGWLLIFDNADDRDLLEPYWLEGKAKQNGHVLITSRTENWGQYAKTTPLEKFSTEEAVALLQLLTTETDETELGVLAQTLDRLPLALEQAAAYMRATPESAEGYVELFEEYRQELLAESPAMYTNRTIATVWNISLKRLAKQSPQALNLLRLCSFLAPDDIPLQLLLDGAEALPPELSKALANRFLLNKLTTALNDYSLIKRRGESLSVHRLVQAVIRGQLSAEGRVAWLQATAKLLETWFDYEDIDTTAVTNTKQVFPHLLRLFSHANKQKWQDGRLANLLQNAGTYLRFNGDDQQAEDMLNQALNLSKTLHGTESVDTARVQVSLGAMYREQAKFEQGESYLRQALQSYQATVGQQHTDTASCLEQLGHLFYHQSKFEEVQSYYEQALTIRQQLFPDQLHINIADSFNNLGLVHQGQGDYDTAQDYFERAIKIKEATVGRHHNSTATTLSNLGALLSDRQQYAQAQPYLEEALEITSAVLGRQHPELVGILNNLATVHKGQQNFPQAQIYYEQALAVGEQVLGRENSDTAALLSNMGDFLLAQGKKKEAVPYLQRALRILEKTWGKKHPRSQEVRQMLNFVKHGTRRVVFKRR
ncbi:FxSxx-COOH system tetratricopeptide repeat protein [Anaerolineales bacterium HSG6]|nr:FxSxx-COOH system tetratricopeptide repeat protein [Anaerolineales bacterium HSG6]